MKRFLSVLLALMLVLGMMPTIALAEGTIVTADTSAISTLKAGDMFVVPVNISGNTTGISNFDLQVSYPAEMLTLTKISAYPTAEDASNGTNGGICASGTFVGNEVTGIAGWIIDPASTANRTLFYLYFTVNSGTAGGSAEISISIMSGGTFQNNGVNINPAFVSGTVAITPDTTVNPVEFYANGEVYQSFDTADAVIAFAEPAKAGYVFVGWYKDVANMVNVAADGNGDYVIDGTNVFTATFSGKELRPKYDAAPDAGGDYHALWLDPSDTVHAVMIKKADGSFQYFSGTDVLHIFLDKALAEANGGRIKLLSDLTVTGSTSVTLYDSYNVLRGTYQYLDRSNGILYVLGTQTVTLDMNGHTLREPADFTSVTYAVEYTALVEIAAGGSLSLEDSSYAGGGTLLQEGHDDYSPVNVFSVIHDTCYIPSMRDITAKVVSVEGGGNAFSFSECEVGSIENCTFIAQCADGVSLVDGYDNYCIYCGGFTGSIGSIINCTLESDDCLMLVCYGKDSNSTNPAGNVIGSITGTTMTSTGTGSTAAIEIGGIFTFGVGNTVTTAKDVLFSDHGPDYGENGLIFSAITGSIYQTTADGGKAFSGDYLTITTPAGYAAIDNSGTVAFVPGYTVTFMDFDGGKRWAVRSAAAGQTIMVPSSPSWEDEGLKVYALGGWSQSIGGPAVDLSTIQADTTLYALRSYSLGTPAVELTLDGTTTQHTKLAEVIQILENLNGSQSYTATIKLLSDQTMDGMDFFNSSYAKDLTIDLNGHTLNSNSNLYVAYSDSDFSLTIKDSSADGSGVMQVSGYNLVYLYGTKTTANIESGTLISDTDTVFVGNGSVCNISGGHIKTSAWYCSALWNYYSTATISGSAMLESTNYYPVCTTGDSGNIYTTISGGYFKGHLSYDVLMGASKTAITGGVMSVAPLESGPYAGYNYVGTPLTVNWKDGDGNVFHTDSVPYGAVYNSTADNTTEEYGYTALLSVPAGTPTKAPADPITYVFNGWLIAADTVIRGVAVIDANFTTVNTADGSKSTETDIQSQISNGYLDKIIVDAVVNTGETGAEDETVTVTLDSDAKAAINSAIGEGGANAGAAGVYLEAKALKESTLTSAQFNAVKSSDAKFYDFTLKDDSGADIIFSQNTTTGKATVKLPFTLPEGKSGGDFKVYWFKEDGTKVDMNATYVDGCYTFETTHFSVYGVDDANTSYTMTVNIADPDFNVGDTINASIVAATNQSGKTFSTFQFTLSYDTDRFELVSLTPSQEGSTAVNSGTLAYNVNNEDGISVDITGTPIATFQLKVKAGAAEGELKNITLTSCEMTTTGDNVTSEVTPVSDSVTLHNLTVTLQAGSGMISGSKSSLTLYAKYESAGLYTDEARTTAVSEDPTTAADAAYRLANRAGESLWYNTEGDKYAAVTGEGGLASQTFTASKTYTLQTVKTYVVTFASGSNGSIGMPTSLTYDAGSLLNTQTLPIPTPDTNYTFDGWYSGETKIDTAAYAVTGDVTLTAKFVPGSFAITGLANGTGYTVSVTGGVDDSKATYLTPVVFTVTPDTSYAIKSVTYTVGAGSAQSAVESAGSYTIPGDNITGDVAVEIIATHYYTVTFQAGTGSTMQTATAYAVAGTSALYTSVANLLSGTASFTVPTPAASTGYRLAKDTAEEPLWSDGANNVQTSAIGSSYNVSADTTFTARAIKQWTVSFVSGGNGTVVPTSIPVDDGYTLQPGDLPTTTGASGYTFKEWQLGGAAKVPVGTVVTSDLSYTAIFEHGTWAVSLPTTATVSFTGASTATHADSGDYTFTMAITDPTGSDPGSKVTKVTYTVGGITTTISENANGIASGTSFTIPLNMVTGAVSVNFEATDTYQITVAAGSNGRVNDTSSATKTFTKDYVIQSSDFTVTADPGYTIDGWANGDDPFGDPVTANKTYTVTFKDASYSLTENGIITSNGVTHGANYSFIPTVSSKVVTGGTVTIGGGAYTPTENNDGSYTIAGSAITGNVAITYTMIDGSWMLVTKDTYAALDTGTQVAILYTAKLESGTYALTGYGDMFWSSRYNGYVYIVADTETAAALSAKLSTSANTVTELAYNGDLNGSGTTTSSDSATINDVLHGITTLYSVDIRTRLEMDLTGNRAVSTQDIVWVLQKAVDLTPTVSDDK